MNILFFLTPKENVAYVVETDNMGQVMDKMEEHGYTAVPLLSCEGRYIGTITEGDLLWTLKEQGVPKRISLDEISVTAIRRRRDNQAVNVQASMEHVFQKVTNQNFVPVVDDNKVFIGIVTRKDLLLHLAKQVKENKGF